MPAIVDLILAIGRGLFTKIVGCCFFSENKDDKRIWMIVDFILAIIIVAILARQLVVEVGLNYLRTKLWGNNFGESIAPVMVLMPLIIMLGQTWAFKLLKTDYVENSPKLHKFLLGSLRPEMITLMVNKLVCKKNNLS